MAELKNWFVVSFRSRYDTLYLANRGATPSDESRSKEKIDWDVTSTLEDAKRFTKDEATQVVDTLALWMPKIKASQVQEIITIKLIKE